MTSSFPAIIRLFGVDDRRDRARTPESANQRNMMLLIQLRWLAVAGQLVTIVVVEWGMGLRLPVWWLLLAPALLAVVNLASAVLLQRRRPIVSDAQLFAALLLDVAALTWQLYWSGGATNPFAGLFLMHVVLGAVLLTPRNAWLLIGVTTACFAVLGLVYRPLVLPGTGEGMLLDLYLQGSLVCFALTAVLLVLFVTRINSNLKARDAYLADLRQQAAEQGHIVRMGLLASGAAHELGTPLASLSVILSDWRRMPAFDDPELAHDMAQMQAEVERCKAIVTGILMSAGEARGEAPVRTTVRAFLADTAAEWEANHPGVVIERRDGLARDPAIISDSALRQVFSALFDNALEAGARRIELWTSLADGTLVIIVADDGRGFDPQILERLGQPYQSTKGRPGAGLGLFLLVNVLRTLGGAVEATGRPGGGAELRLTLPLAALAAKEI
ncbi:ATP-binding protein [Phenylobacterium sp. LjRoot219]|uniref:ATP-binding protein n=1 Tax=Phenylobacterium sp. LjRoot219 TaxID=3342283 RepID=UPI003ECD417C